MGRITFTALLVASQVLFIHRWDTMGTLFQPEDALYKEFKKGFFGTLNVERKDRWGFEQVAWLSTSYECDVDTPYSDTWLSIFEASGETSEKSDPLSITMIT